MYATLRTLIQMIILLLIILLLLIIIIKIRVLIIMIITGRRIPERGRRARRDRAQGRSGGGDDLMV